MDVVGLRGPKKCLNGDDMFIRRLKILRVKAGDSRSFFGTINLAGQAMIEATFSIVVLVGLILSMIKVFSWVGRDLSNRRAAHEQSLISPIANGATDVNDTYRQIRPSYYEGTPIDAAMINSEIFGSNRM